MIIRRSQPSDTDTLRDLFATVYSEGFFERIQAAEARIPRMSFVALGDDDEVIGHVGASRGTVDDAPVLALVPASVDPNRRGRRCHRPRLARRRRLQWGTVMEQGRNDGTPTGPDDTAEPKTDRQQTPTRILISG